MSYLEESPQGPIWQAPADMVPLASDIHVWRAALDRTESEVAQLESCLSADEKARGARLVFKLDRLRFIAGRGILRLLLGQYTNQSPEALRFRYGPQGKPSLADRCDVCFNLSHSAGIALFAFVRNRAIGIDTEWERRDLDFEGISRRFFSELEKASLRSIPEGQRLSAFFACWVRKEAYTKALGCGFRLPLERFDMTLAPEQAARLIADRGDPAASGRWTVYDIRPHGECAGAAAVEGHEGQLQLWDLVQLALP